MTAADPDKSERSAEGQLVPLFLAHQARIYSFIVSLVANRSDAEDLLQETGLVLHQRFAEFQQGTSFLNWACQIAYHKVLDLRKNRSRHPLHFDSNFVEVMAEHQLCNNEVFLERQAALLNCLEKLPGKDRQLVDRCYHSGVTVRSVAEQLGRPVDTLYKSLRRIRGNLFDCITRTLSGEGRR